MSVMALLLELTKLSTPYIIIIRGIPGSGKSTLAQRYIQLTPDVVHCEADHYFINKQGKYSYNGSKMKLAHQYCQQTMRNALGKGQSVIVSCGEFTNTHHVPADVVAKMALNYEPYPDEIRYIPT
ncbi:AAA family ATPase [Moritella viscosa]